MPIPWMHYAPTPHEFIMYFSRPLKIILRNSCISQEGAVHRGWLLASTGWPPGYQQRPASGCSLQLCDLGKVTWLPYVPVSPCLKQGPLHYPPYRICEDEMQQLKHLAKCS